MHKLESLIHQILLEELNSYEQFEGWITPDNKVIKVSNHLTYIMTQFHIDSDTDQDNENILRELYYNHAFNHGWVRFINFPYSNDNQNNLMIESNKIGRIRLSLKKTLREFVRPDSVIIIECPEYSHWFDLKHPSDTRKFNLFMNGQINEQYEQDVFNAWIKPNGEFVKVPNHISYLIKHYRLPIGTDELYLKAYNDGWVRLVVNIYEIDVTAQNFSNVTKILHRLFKNVIMKGERKKIYIDDVNDNHLEFDTRTSDGIEKLKEFIRKYKPNHLFEQTLKKYEFNVWVSPDNEYIELSDEMHIEYMEKLYYKSHPKLPDVNYEGNSMDSTIFKWAFKLGWVRYHYYYGFNGDTLGQLVIDGINEKRIANVLSRLFHSFIMKNEHKEIHVGIVYTKKSFSFKTNSSIGVMKLKQFINQFARHKIPLNEIGSLGKHYQYRLKTRILEPEYLDVYFHLIGEYFENDVLIGKYKISSDDKNEIIQKLNYLGQEDIKLYPDDKFVVVLKTFNDIPQNTIFINDDLRKMSFFSLSRKKGTFYLQEPKNLSGKRPSRGCTLIGLIYDGKIITTYFAPIATHSSLKLFAEKCSATLLTDIRDIDNYVVIPPDSELS